MNRAKLLVIIRREYLSRVKSIGFVVGTILTPLLLTALLVLPALFIGRGSPRDYRLVILDHSGDVALYERAAALLMAKNANSDRFQLRREAVSEAESGTRRQELNREISEGKLDTYLVIPAAVLDEGKIAYHTRNIGDFVAETRVENAFNAAVSERRMTRSGLNVEQTRELSRKIIMEKFDRRGEAEDWRKTIMAFTLMGILCLTVLAYGGHLMSAVIEEKQSRIIEILLSSVEPFHLMLGKLVGVGLVGLTQYTVWAGLAVLLSGLTTTQSMGFASFRLPQISISLMVFFVLFFLLGYFLYATLFVMLGAIVSNEEDGQQVLMPLMILILLGPAAAGFVWRQPDSVAAAAVSLFPFFSPFAMYLRIALQHPPLWQVALSILLMIATIFGAVWLAARLYRMGVLMYGKRPTILEMTRWLSES